MAEWQIRVVGSGLVDPRALIPNPYNWRLHPVKQQEALEAAIKDVGYLRSVTVNQRTGHLLDGHLRAEMAILADIPEIPVEYVDIAPEEEPEALASLDPLAAMAQADPQALDALLREVSTGEEALQKLFADLAEEAGLYKEEYAFIGDQEQDGADGETGEQASARAAAEDSSLFAQFPVAIVLNREEFNRWRQIKQDLGATGDKEAFKLLWPGEGGDAG